MNKSIMSVLAAAAGFAAAVATAAPVKEVRVRHGGPGPSDESMARTFIGVRVGQEMDSAAVSQDVRKLLSCGRFSDARAEIVAGPDGVILTYVVVNRLRLAGPVVVTGARRFPADEVSSLLGLSPDDLFDDALLAVRGHKVEEAYRKAGYPGVRLDWKTVVTDERMGWASVELAVDEGRRSKLIRIDFTGNANVPTSELREAVGQDSWWKPKRWAFGQWLRDGELSDDALAAAREAARQVCMEYGFLDAKTGEPSVREIRKGIYSASMNIVEGPIYKVGKISTEGISRYPEAEVRREIALKSGAPVSMRSVAETADAMRQYYTSRGYLRTEVEPVLGVRKDEKGGGNVLDMLFRVTEGSLVYVRNIYIRGNASTREEVIRRELVVYPGDVSDERKIRKSEMRLRNLGYFSQVGWRFDPTQEKDRNDLVFMVEEQNTGHLMIGGSFSSIDRLAAYVEVSEGNFDLFSWPPRGGGQKLRLRAQIGELNNAAEIDFTEPWFLGRPLSMRLNLLVENHDYDAYDIRTKSASISIGKPLRHFFHRMEVTYRLERTEITDITDTNRYTRVGGGHDGEPYYFEYTNAVKSTLSLSFLRDTRDHFFFPSDGHRLQVGGGVSGGILGGDTGMWSLEVKGEKYFPLWWRHVLAVHGRAAVLDSYGDTRAVPVFDRLHGGGSGGESMIRGYSYRSIGPKVSRVLNETGRTEYRAIGGKTAIFGNVEYVVPLVEKLKMAVFADAGQVAEDAFRMNGSSFATSVGLELRLDMMQFPVRFNYAWPMHKDDEFTDTQSWGFWIGSSF